MKTSMIFVRHGEAEGNLYRRFQGWTDGDLTEKGHLQAQLAAERLKDYPIDVLYSSTLKRALKTAGYISRIKNLPIIRTDKLKEINGGDWEDMPFSKLPEKWPELNETWEKRPHLHNMPNGEAMDEFNKRVLDETMYIINHNKGSNICIVTHGTVIKTLMCHFQGCSLEEMVNIPWYDNTSITIIEYNDGNFTPVIEGDNSHLPAELKTIENQDWWKEYKTKTEMK